MQQDYQHYGDPYGRPREKVNLFAWSIAILLLTGLAFAAWLGSFYIFGQPERPESYRLLKKLHKIEPAKRFELTAAPPGEFLAAKQLYDRYIALSPTELAKTNAELTRNYIRNFQSMRGLVPYVVGRFNVMEARELTSDDVIINGMIALTNAVDHGQILMEHVYPSDPQALPLMKQTLATGLEIKLERTHDLSAIIHAERLIDGRIMITAMPLLYGSYTVTRAPGTFSLEPPLDLNLKAGWPIFKEKSRITAERRYRERVAPISQSTVVAGLAPTPPQVAANALIRVEPAQQVEAPKAAPIESPTPVKLAANQKGGKLAKNKKATPTPAPAKSPATTIAAQPSPPPTASSVPVTPPVVASNSGTPSGPSISPTPLTAEDSLASTAGGGNWKTFPAGKMPVGRLIQTSDLRDLAERGLAGERVYLKGQFVVNFTEPYRAVLRPRTRLTDAVLHPLGGGGQSVRIVVEFPVGYVPPVRGSTVTRDEARPYEITEVRKQSDGQLNVFAREIMQ